MSGSDRAVRVGSRKSQLALIQSEYVIMLLKELYPDKTFEIVKMSTVGDKILDTALSKIGEKSLFTRELENALLDRRVDLVVHSLKDLPTMLPDNLVIGAVLKRDDPRDAVVMHPRYQDRKIGTLAEGSVIGTSSLRRAAQLKRRFPHLKFEDVRGNLNTRLHKLDGGDTYAALILAAAGLRRMGWHDRITHVLEPEDCMYAVSQGALGVECRAGDDEIQEMLHKLIDFETMISCIAERAFLKKLEGGCSVPVAVSTEIKNDQIKMIGGVYSIDGSEAVIADLETKLRDSDEPVAKKRAMESGDRQFSCIVAKHISYDAMLTAETLGIDLAVKIAENGGEEILSKTKKEMVAAIEKLKAEKAAAEKNEDKMMEQVPNSPNAEINRKMAPPSIGGAALKH